MWVREGDCPPEKCGGRCCEHIGLWFDHNDPDFIHSLETRGVPIRHFKDKVLVELHQRCQYLTKEGLCGLHPSMEPEPSLPSRPEFCNDWPTEPGQMLIDPNCGFTFKWVDDSVGE